MVAEKARKSIEARAGDAAGRTVTVSMGIASFGPGADSPAELIAAADRALYRAKDAGRNRVQAARTPKQSAIFSPESTDSVITL